MPSDKAMWVWAIGLIVLLWVGLSWMMYDQLFWSPEGTPVEVIHQLSRKGQLLAHGVTVFGIVGALLMTRVAGRPAQTRRSSV